jgi:hypothetical protein
MPRSLSVPAAVWQPRFTGWARSSPARQHASRGVELWNSGGMSSPVEEVHSSVVVCLCFRALCQWHFGENFQIPNVNGSVGNPASNRADRLFPSRWADSRESHSQACRILEFDSPRSSHWKRIL